VARWLTEGEHEQLEYKQTLKEPSTRTSFAETVAAFANGNGGAVLVGVDDEGRPVGYTAAKARDQVANVLADLIEEPPTVEVHEVQISDRPVVVVIVSPSAPHRKPHQVKGRVMLRALGTTRQATPAELRQLLS
jgi:ATP-dependent DNA helicase RecG